MSAGGGSRSRKQRRSSDTEQAILDAAEQVFAEFGFAGARTQQIADAAGVNKAMLYYYFESKDLLHRAVLDRILFELIKLVQQVQYQGGARIQRVDAFISGFVDYVARHPHFGRLTYMGSGAQGRHFEDIVTTFFRPLFQRGVRMIEEGIAAGEFRQVDASQLLLSIYATAMGYFADAHLIGLVINDDALSKRRVKACKESLLDTVYAALGVDRPARG